MNAWKYAIAIGFAAFVQCGLGGSAVADDDDHRHGHWHGDRGRYEHHDRHWRPHYYTREYYYAPRPQVYYAPPPVYVVPPRPPSVGFNLIFPFRFD